MRVRQDVTMGGQLTLNCTAWYGQAEVLPQFRRRPATAVFWHKEWKPLARNRAQVKVTIYRNEIRASLVILSVTCHDVGWYHCMVINDFPKNVVQTMFRVQVRKRKFGTFFIRSRPIQMSDSDNDIIYSIDNNEKSAYSNDEMITTMTIITKIKTLAKITIMVIMMIIIRTIRTK